MWTQLHLRSPVETAGWRGRGGTDGDMPFRKHSCCLNASILKCSLWNEWVVLVLEKIFTWFRKERFQFNPSVKQNGVEEQVITLLSRSDYPLVPSCSRQKSARPLHNRTIVTLSVQQDQAKFHFNAFSWPPEFLPPIKSRAFRLLNRPITRRVCIRAVIVPVIQSFPPALTFTAPSSFPPSSLFILGPSIPYPSKGSFLHSLFLSSSWLKSRVIRKAWPSGKGLG